MTRFAVTRRNYHRNLLLTLVGTLLLASTTMAAEHPMLAAGFAPNTIQQGDRYGAVNVLNGALTLPISLGPTYRVNEGLSYGLSLTYSSSFRNWVGKPALGYVQHVRGRSAVGWGWVMHMGRIGQNPNNSPDGGAISGGAFQAPDGSWHKLFLETAPAICGAAYPTCYVTRDGSFIRAVYSSSSAPSPVALGATWRLWTPDGVERELKHILVPGWICGAGESATSCQAKEDFAGWYTTKILSANGAVGADVVNIEYDPSRPHAILNVWDSARGQTAPTIQVSSDWSGHPMPPNVPERTAANGGLVRRVTFATSNSTGASSVYDLSYDAAVPLPETCYLDSQAQGLNVPLLRKIELHQDDASSPVLTTTEIEYDTTGLSPPYSGQPGHVPVRVSTYQNDSPADALSATYVWDCVDYTEREDPECHETSTCFCLADTGRRVMGVYQKCNDLHDGGQDCWTYDRTLQLPPPASCDPDLFPCGCTFDPPYGCVYETNPWRVTVDLPAQPSASPPGWRRNQEIHYFTSGCSAGKRDPAYPNGIERRVELVGVNELGSPKVWLTRETEHEWDNYPLYGREQYNLRPKHELTTYDNGNTTERDHALWDGAGHYQFAQERTTEGCLGGPCPIARSRQEDYEVTLADRDEWFLGRRKSLRVYDSWDGLSGLSQHHEFNWDEYGRLWTETRHSLGIWPDVKLYHGWVGNQVRCEMSCGGDGPACPAVGAADRLDNCGMANCNPLPSAANLTSVQEYWKGLAVQKGHKGQLWWSENRELSASGLPTRDWDPDAIPRYSRSIGYDAAERTREVRFLDNGADDERKLALTWLAIDTLFWQRPGTNEARGIIKYDAYGRQRQTTIARPFSMSSADVDFAKDMAFDFAGNKVYDSDWCNLTSWTPDTCPSGTGRTEYFDYDPLGRPGLIRHNPSNEVLSTFRYEGMTTHRTTSKWTETDLEDVEVDLIQDGFGRLVKVVEPYYGSSASRETTYRYDALDRLVRVDMTDGSIAQVARTFSYDGLGNLRSSSEPESGSTDFEKYDARGHLLQSTNARGTTVTQTYDCSERLLTSTASLPASGGVTVKRFTYDDLGRGSRLWKDEYQNLSGEVVERAYTYYGRMGRWSETFSQFAGFSVDEDLIYNDLGLPETWYYPNQGSGGGLNVVFSYDRGFLRAQDKLTGEPLVTNVTYDPSGARKRIDFGGAGGNPGPIFSDRQYDARNRVESITTGPGTYASGGYSYDPSGNIYEIGADDFTYDFQDQLSAAGVSGNAFEYFYDGFGNLTSSTGIEPIAAPVDSTTNRLVESPTGFDYLATGSLSQAPGGVSYAYDGFERMVSATTPNGTTDYLYDSDGHRVSSSGGSSCSPGHRSLRTRDGRLMAEFGCSGWIRDYIYGGRELVGAVQSASGRKPSFWAFQDDCGIHPMIRFEVGAFLDACGSSSIQIFERDLSGCYDFRDPIRSTTEHSQCPERWSVSAHCVPGFDCSQRCFVARLVTESGELGPMSKEICPGLEPLPQVECNVGYVPGSGCPQPGEQGYPKLIEAEFTRYFLSDHLGTPRTIVRADGGPVADTMQLGPFGEDLDAPSCAQRRRFTGHERDEETALDYMMARYYGRGFGRFLRADPGSDLELSDPQSWNRYTYVRNNPLKRVDPDGRLSFLVTAGLGALEGAAFQIAINHLSGDSWNKGVLRELAVGGAIGATGFGVAKLAEKGVDAYRVAKAAKAVKVADRLGTGAKAGLKVGRTLNATVGDEAAGVVREVLKSRAPLDALAVEERAAAGAFYRKIAQETTGEFAEAARQFNVARAEFLEGARQSIPSTLHEFMKLSGF